MTHHVRRHAGRILVVLVGVVACIAFYRALVIPAQDTKNVLNKLRQDNVTLCAYFRGEDRNLGKITKLGTTGPVTVTGRTIVDALNGLRGNARAVAVSPICPPPK